MPGAQDHIILKNVLRIKVRDPKTAHETQNRAIDWFNKEVLPMIESALDRLSTPGELIQLDQVQLDFGSIDLSKPSQELKLRVYDEVMKSMEEAVANARRGNNGQQVAQADVDWRRFIQFLETGHLNWEVTDKDFGPTELLEKLLDEQPDRLNAHLPRLLGNRKVMERLSLQFKPDLLWRWITMLAPLELRLKSDLEEVIRLLRILWPQLPIGARLEALTLQVLLVWQARKMGGSGNRQLWQEKDASNLNLFGILLDFFQDSGLVPPKFLISSIQESLQSRSWENFEEFLNGLDGSKFKNDWTGLKAILKEVPDAQAILRNILPQLLEQVWQNPANANQDWQASLLPNFRLAIEQAQTPLEAPARQKLSQFFEDRGIQRAKGKFGKPKTESKQPKISKEVESDFTDLDPDGIYVSNAGLVLLNPFFQNCFESLGWMENGEWKDALSQENGVMLLAYMASGEEELAETMLPLPKLLCGMSIDEPVRMKVELEKAALEEADSLLTAANQYWEKAGKLNPDQFRAAFLYREGKLKHIESGWNLVVDRQTIDILIEFIPWGFGTIMLRWMKGLLTVEW